MLEGNAMNVGRFQLLLWWGFEIGRKPVPKAFSSIYAWFFWLGPLEIRKFVK